MSKKERCQKYVFKGTKGNNNIIQLEVISEETVAMMIGMYYLLWM